MIVTTASRLRQSLKETIEAVAQYNEVVTVTSKHGNVVIVSESDYNAMIETVHLMSSPGVLAELTKAKASDSSEFIDYDPDEEW